MKSNNFSVSPSARARLERVAKQVNWYTPPAALLADPKRFLCQVMARGGADDIVEVRRHFDPEDFVDAYRHAPPGLFDNPSWAYWGLILLDDPAALPRPVRFPGDPSTHWRGTSAGRWD